MPSRVVSAICSAFGTVPLGLGALGGLADIDAATDATEVIEEVLDEVACCAGAGTSRLQDTIGSASAKPRTRELGALMGRQDAMLAGIVTESEDRLTCRWLDYAGDVRLWGRGVVGGDLGLVLRAEGTLK